MRTALAADESDPRRFATDGIIPAGPSITLGPCDGYIIPREDMSTASSAGTVVVTLDLDPDALRRAALEIAARLWPERASREVQP